MLACSWSGGKDCCQAYWKVVTAGNNVGYFLNTYRRESGRVAFHGVRAELVRKQAESMGVQLLQKEVFGNHYEEQFLEALEELEKHDVTGVVFGDIDVIENRKWVENVCRKAGLDSYFPIWGIDQKTILTDFFRMGFKAVVVALDQRFLSEGELGHELDDNWVSFISRFNSIEGNPILTYCGENGEYHTFVYDGPAFRYPLDIRFGKRVNRDGHWLMDITL
jgi:uncharacterized protein (TIGR00290 family)